MVDVGNVHIPLGPFYRGVWYERGIISTHPGGGRWGCAGRGFVAGWTTLKQWDFNVGETMPQTTHLGMVTIPPIKMVMTCDDWGMVYCFTTIKSWFSWNRIGKNTHNWWFDWDTVGICRYNNNDSKNSQDTNDSNNDYIIINKSKDINIIIVIMLLLRLYYQTINSNTTNENCNDFLKF